MTDPTSDAADSTKSLAVGCRVYAAGGRWGRLDDIVLDPIHWRVTHHVLQRGHLWGHREITIPLGDVQDATAAGPAPLPEATPLRKD